MSESETVTGSDINTLGEKSATVEKVQKTLIAQAEPTERSLVEGSFELDSEKAVALISIIKIETSTGGVYYMRAETWAERKSKEDIFLCSSTGQPVKSGERAKLRQSTIRASQRTSFSINSEPEMRPLGDISQYLPQQVDNSSENLSV